MKAFKTKSPPRGIAVILLGRPGSGKDTQAELLAKKFGLVHIISSQLIEKALKSKSKTIKLGGRTYNVERERCIQKSGYLNTPNFVAALVKNKIKTVSRGSGIIMSGSPRTLLELREEMPVLRNIYGKSDIYFFNIIISPKEVYVRNLKRHRKDLPELDSRKIIKKRLEIFNRDTLPVIKLLKKQKKIAEINGEQSIMKIHLGILKYLHYDKDKNKRRN